MEETKTPEETLEFLKKFLTEKEIEEEFYFGDNDEAYYMGLGIISSYFNKYMDDGPMMAKRRRHYLCNVKSNNILRNHFRKLVMNSKVMDDICSPTQQNLRNQNLKNFIAALFGYEPQKDTISKEQNDYFVTGWIAGWSTLIFK